MRVKPTGQSAEYDYKGGEPTGAKFELRVEDVFSITGRGTVVTGKTALGPIKKGDTVAIVREGNQVMETRIKAIEQFRKVLDYADPDTNVGLLLDGVKREEVQRDDLIVKY